MFNTSKQHAIKKTAVFILVFLIGIVVPATLVYTYSIPIPHIHDEFAYLLQADTFSHGRLTNPTHPLHQFFETFHVFHTPSYQAKYPPGQGLFLAAGKVLFGLPVAGIWLSAGLSSLSLFWLLTAFVSHRWAALTTIIFIFNPTLLISWSQSYWGGYVAFTGGALYFGGLFRLLNERKPSITALILSGAFLLSISRPAEGLLTILISLPYLLWSLREKFQFREKSWYLNKIVLISFTGITFIILFQLIYNYAVSGSPFIYPYFNWTFKDSEIELIRNYAGSPHISAITELNRAYHFFYPPFLCLMLIGLFLSKEKTTIFFCIFWILLVSIVSAMATPAWPHYLAPIAPLSYLLIGLAFYAIEQHFLPEKRLGKLLASGLFLVFLFHSVTIVLRFAHTEPPYTWGRAKQDITSRLRNNNLNNIVFVRYRKNHDIHSEWVYNDADIDQSAVIWARDLGDQANQSLISYYPLRAVWLLEPDNQPMTLIRYKLP